MKNYLSTINRGIALGLVLIIGLSVYLIHDAMAFTRRETETIRLMIEEFLTTTEQLHHDLYTAESQDRLQALINDYLNTYYTDFRDRRAHPQQMNARQSAESSLLMLSQDTVSGMVGDISFTLIDIQSIQKQSTNAASIRFTMRVSGNGAPWEQYFNGAWANMVDWQRGFEFRNMIFLPGGGYGLVNRDATQSEEYSEDFEVEYQVNALLIREGGTWRWGTFSAWGHSGFRNIHHSAVVDIAR